MLNLLGRDFKETNTFKELKEIMYNELKEIMRIISQQIESSIRHRNYEEEGGGGKEE